MFKGKWIQNKHFGYLEARDCNGGRLVSIDRMLPIGVPPDGTEVQAEAFVLGQASGICDVAVREDGSSTVMVTEWKDPPKPGETKRFAIVELPEPVELPERVFGDDSDITQSVGEQLIEGLTEFAESLELPAERETGGPRWDYKPATGEQFLLRHGDNDMYFSVCMDRKCTFRVSSKRDGTLMVGVPIGVDSGVELMDLEVNAAHLAARAKARELGLVREEPVAPAVPGPRWKAPVEQGLEISQFITTIGDNDYHVGAWHGVPRIVRVGDRLEWWSMPLPNGTTDSNARDWVNITSNAIANEYRQAYDTALAANLLPEHPRYPKPEGATDWLGWFGEKPNGTECDGWWNGTDVCLVASGFSMGWRTLDAASLMPALYTKAATRARELRLPERAAAQARVAALREQLAEAERGLSEITSTPCSSPA